MYIFEQGKERRIHEYEPIPPYGSVCLSSFSGASRRRVREEARGEVTADSRAAAAARLHFPTNKYPPRSIRSLYLYPSSFVCTLVMRLTPTGSRPGSPRERLGRELALHRIRTPKQAGRQAGDDNNSRFYSGGSVLLLWLTQVPT